MEIDDGELIQCVRKFPSVYDKNHSDYRDKSAKINAWISIGTTMGVSEELCEQRWVVLRNRYATELRNRKKNTPANGSTWRFSEAMSFLEKYISPRRTRSSFGSKTTTKTESENLTSNGIPPEALVAVEMGSRSPNPNVSTNPKLRPIAPRPAVSTVARLVTFPNVTQNGQNFSTGRQYDSKEKQEMEDEDVLFGKSIGYTLKTIKNKKTKLEVKGKILAILAQHAE